MTRSVNKKLQEIQLHVNGLFFSQAGKTIY